MSTESPANNSLVSIICRTLGRPELQQALQSIASQDYSNIEIILVDAAGRNALDTSGAGNLPLNLITTNAKLSRSQAANAGLDAANGKYIQFLDDDDWIAPNHISQLVIALQNNDEVSAAYSNTQKMNATGDPLDYVFKESFDPILLMRDNYIPIHSILFESSLLQNACRFDETFDIYEDWDFWLQLIQYSDFEHVDSISAYYREGGDSETAVEDVRKRYETNNVLGKARAAIFDKWLPKWTGQKMNALIGQLDQSVLVCEQDARIHSEMRKNVKLQNEIEKRKMEIDELNLNLSDTNSRLEQLKLNSTLHIKKLEQQLNTIYQSTSWKLMGPVRRAGRAFAKEQNISSSEKDAKK